MKIKLCTIVSLILCAAVSAGCGKSGQQEPTATAAASAEPASESSETAGADAEKGESVYKVLVADQFGEPVSGARVQFCSDEMCLFAVTGTDGIAEFETDEGQGYEVHLFKVPDNYESDDTVYPVPDKYCTVEVTAYLKEDAADITNDTYSEEDYNNMTIESLGIRLEPKGVYKDLNGFIACADSGLITDSEPYVWGVFFSYFGYDKYDREEILNYINYEYTPALIAGKPVPEAPDSRWENWENNYGYIFSVFSIGNGKGKEELSEILEYFFGFTFDLEEAGKSDDVTFFVAEYPEHTQEEIDILKENMDPEYFEEYSRLIAGKQDFIDSLSFFTPVYPMSVSEGSVISFETVDLDGNTVTSEELFSGSKLTMLNFWGTTCRFCIDEMPGLEEMYEKYRDKGFNIVGICTDAESDQMINIALSIISENGVTYLNCVPFANMSERMPIAGTPTSIFVDSEGKVVGEMIAGTDFDAYYEIIENYFG